MSVPEFSTEELSVIVMLGVLGGVVSAYQTTLTGVDMWFTAALSVLVGTVAAAVGLKLFDSVF